MKIQICIALSQADVLRVTKHGGMQGFTNITKAKTIGRQPSIKKAV